MSKTISMCQGKGSLSHNNREFTAKNIDSSRTADNIIFVRQDLGEVYHQLFDEAIDRYNARQKRNDRRIPDYFQHLFNREPSKSVIEGTNKQKSFYEHLVYIGTKDDTGVGTTDAEITKECLREYMESFQERNPSFYVFNAVMHLDEATPHLHIDYIPLGHFFNGLEKRNAMAKALEEMGYGKGANAINRWRESEWKVLHDICEKHDIEISEPQKSRGYSFTTQEYGEYKDAIKELKAEKEQAESERDEARAELDKVSKKKTKLTEIDNLKTGKTMFGKKITLSEEDYNNLVDLAKKEVTGVKQTKKLKAEKSDLLKKVADLEAQVTGLTAEVEKYKPKEGGFITRESMKRDAKRISTEDELRRKLKKALVVIDRYGLRDEYNHVKLNMAQSKAVLE